MIKNSANKYFPKIQATCIGLPLAKLLPVHGTNLRHLACPARFERATYALEGRCSIQLSYGQMETRIAGLKNHGRGERIRTFDPLLPKQMRYQAALRPDKVAILHGRSNST